MSKLSQAKKDSALKQLNEANIKYFELNNGYHFKIRIPYEENNSLNFYPTTGKWTDDFSGESGDDVQSLIRQYKKICQEYEKKGLKVKEPGQSSNKDEYPRIPEIVRDANLYVDRLKVPGGWLINTMHLGNHGVLTTMFFSDKEYKWVLEPNPPEVKP